MALLSISAAARAAGVDRATIHRALKSGRLSATVDETGARVIDTAELARVFPLKSTGERVTVTEPARIAEESVAVLRERIRGLEEQRELYRRQLEVAQQALEAVTLRLPPPATPQPPDRGVIWAACALLAAIALGVGVVLFR